MHACSHTHADDGDEDVHEDDDEDDNDGGEDGGSGMITDHASIVFANGGGVSAPNPPPLPRCLKPFLKPALHNMSLFAPPPLPCEQYVCKRGGAAPPHQHPACASLLDSM